MEKLKSKNGKYVSSKEEIFKRHADISDENNCWEWKAFKNAKGYGQTKIGGRSGKLILSHRLSWVINFGEIPEGLHVCHKCDNPSCVNPNHLFLGTNLDNIKDRVSKGRSHRIWLKVDREKQPRCKITNKQIIEIIELKKSKIPALEISKIFNVNVSHIYRLIKKFNSGEIKLSTLESTPV